jgi:Cytochrome c554 and c-prime
MRHYPRHRAVFLLGLLGMTSFVGDAYQLRCSSGQEMPALPGSAHSPTSRANRTFKNNGAGSCSAVACHGSIAPVPGSKVLRNEHTTWVSDDPHSLAYQALFSQRSTRIARNLAGGSETFTPAHQDSQCLACHATPRSVADLKATAGLNQDGVACEACHGPSQKWLSEHTSSAWINRSAHEKETAGFYDTKNLARRAGICAGCHVGSRSSLDDLDPFPARDVNHDLIAAGHPRLTFELAAYLDNLPVHWLEKDRNAAPDFPVRAWSVGQAESARAALDLLAARATDSTSPWPEFSTYGCFSCHHSLADEPWRQRAPFAASSVGVKVPLGGPPFGSWDFAMTSALADLPASVTAPDDWNDLHAALNQLIQEMSRTVPDRQKAARLARDGARKLEQRQIELSRHTFALAEVKSLIRRWNASEAWQKIGSWDQATQRYLSLVPLHQVWSRLDRDRPAELDQLRAQLESVRDKLRFPEGYDSPRQFSPESFAKPR